MSCHNIKNPFPWSGLGGGEWEEGITPIFRPISSACIIAYNDPLFLCFSLQFATSDPIFHYFKVKFKFFLALHAHFKNFVNFQLKEANFHSNFTNFTPNDPLFWESSNQKGPFFFIQHEHPFFL